ncbi:guanylate kinase [Meiothermus taiwanensis]|jgi:guanylate kinase|uniref:Guanylate kinase n=2 Tax=Meiothermus taiwanensis TaxID=172827 RepID=A0A399E445_9DEIN|nr:guanylate kinase [Meiothermus taiwanensis]AWR86135.1 guanylate kinase [Meiothermus taiwanensis WR-220]KIQ53633.1 guanylate kinase [Meiothermus taiwanensis]KZK15003.1 guanylate kinase [Meiothermus taiwanensis]RIH76742.1 Guanylate kinase [Meiothermus taiwanensis]
MPRGNLFVMTGASGVGKGTIRGRLLEYHRMYYSISMTTRPPRPGERNGVDYYFVSKAEFESRIAQNGFLEWAQYVDDYYGTPKEPVEEALSKGQDVLLEIEVQGALQVKQALPEAILVFIIPPSLSELRRRLLVRGTDSLPKIRKRLERAIEEIRMADRFKYVLVNDQLDKAVSDFAAIIQAERLLQPRMREAIERALSIDPALEKELDELERKRLEAGEAGS